MATEAAQITGVKDKDYDVISFVKYCLSSVSHLDVYIDDAEREGDRELVELFRWGQEMGREGAARGKEALSRRLAG